MTAAAVSARAVPPLQPIKDDRRKIALGIAAGLFFVSLLAVLAKLHFVKRQLKDIDGMAEEADCEHAKRELAAE